MAGLFEALRAAGIRCEAQAREGHLPAVLHGGTFASRHIAVAADDSSQFASAMMLAFSADDEPAEIELRGNAVSRPYLALTVRMLADAGVRWCETKPGTWRRDAGVLRARTFCVEPDASSAGYFFALAAATATTTAVEGIADDSTQADLALLDALAAMGCRITRERARIVVRGGPLRGIVVDLRDAPDAAPTLAAIATIAEGPTTIRGIAHLRDKESDRIATICAEAARLGARATQGDDWLRIDPTDDRPDAIVQSHDDHRIAMAFSCVGAARGGVSISDPDCVSKSFPGYWDEFDRFLAHHRGHGGAMPSREA